jgi:hypothetical protein
LAIFLSLALQYRKSINSLILTILTPQKIIKTLILFCILVLLIISTVTNNIDHYYDRLTLSEDNLSALSWTRGYENARESLDVNPLFGFGLGNNYRAFNSSMVGSTAQNQLDAYDISRLNQNDSFSLFFRLLSEGGLTITSSLLFLAIWLIIKSINNSKKCCFPSNTKYSSMQIKQNIFNNKSKALVQSNCWTENLT